VEVRGGAAQTHLDMLLLFLRRKTLLVPTPIEG